MHAVDLLGYGFSFGLFSGGVSNTLTKRVRSKLLAMNPERFKFTRSSRPSLWPFQIGFLFQVGGFADTSMARGRYRR